MRLSDVARGLGLDGLGQLGLLLFVFRPQMENQVRSRLIHSLLNHNDFVTIR